nr:hypothetical protein [Tanacetum cinerariifolium]
FYDPSFLRFILIYYNGDCVDEMNAFGGGRGAPFPRWSWDTAFTRAMESFAISRVDSDLELKVNAIVRDFLNPSRWKESSKETGSEILPSGDGSCGKMFKPIACLIAKGKLK